MDFSIIFGTFSAASQARLLDRTAMNLFPRKLALQLMIPLTAIVIQERLRNGAEPIVG
jgi:hypothetical protein